MNSSYLRARALCPLGFLLICLLWNNGAAGEAGASSNKSDFGDSGDSSNSGDTRASSDSGDEFFEKKIRPILTDNCFKCHSRTSEKLKGGLYLDSRDGLMKGGEGGPVVDLAKPLRSRLIEAINYENPDLQMPPKRKLAIEQIKLITEWIQRGVPWPEGHAVTGAMRLPAFDLERRRKDHWAWHPIQNPTPPEVADKTWPRTAPDRFLLAKLEQNHLKPAPAAESRTLIRRLYFDLIGLPPKAERVEEFEKAHSDADLERLVDELLGSPRFGERWARHWLDLVRYSETLGHEFDYAIPNAWRYRDYAIRAFNADVPYPQFVTEHIAGDLLQHPRFDASGTINESIIGTAFYWLGQREHSPVDVRLHQAEVIDNQIDVLSKTFLGLTVACARCHDHKFDAISAKDYYSLYGILESCRYTQASIDASPKTQEAIFHLGSLHQELTATLISNWRARVGSVGHHLMASCNAATQTNAAVDSESLKNWMPDSHKGWSRPENPMYAWTQLSKPDASKDFKKLRDEMIQKYDVKRPLENASSSYSNKPQNPFGGWFFEGAASVAVNENLIASNDASPRFRVIQIGALEDSHLTTRLEGVARSPSFELREPYLHILAAGHQSRVKICVDNFTMIRDPIYGGLKKFIDAAEPKWLTFDLRMWTNHRAFIEISDVATPDLTDDSGGDGYGKNGWFEIKDFIFSSSAHPPTLVPPWITLLKSPAVESLSDLAKSYQAAASRALAAFRSHVAEQTHSDADRAVLNALLADDLLTDAGDADALAKESAFYRAVDKLPTPIQVPAMSEADGIEESVFIRGNHKTLGEKVPRRLLTAFSASNEPPFHTGSGRLELARRLTDPDNPLLARVIVNRVWLHLFGRGIVPTPDDFGALGQSPSHPELLDWLAHWFQTDAHGSIKKFIKLLVTSRAYQMSSHSADSLADESDPENILLHRMPIKRLEGEVIRDAMLADSGRLDLEMFGPPVQIHLDEFMEGTGRPGSSGPVDGAGRRSIYQEVRRNFLSPMMRSFDAPIPFTTIGRRTVSNLPAQSLILLNDQFVIGQANIWARHLIGEGPATPTERIRKIYLTAFGRMPNETEISEGLGFLRRQASSYGITGFDSGKSENVWTDFCQVIFNLKEFIFIQ